jgi:carbonic anhydrase
LSDARPGPAWKIEAVGDDRMCRLEDKMRRSFCCAWTLAVGIFAIPAVAAAQTFGYFGDVGPAFWGELSPDWATCGTGEIQSPVNFTKLADHPAPARRFSIDYDANTTGEIFNNGHTIEVETEGSNTLTLDGVAYELVQFHFHTASEHRVESRGYDMELHLVHASTHGSNAVIGVFVKRASSICALAPIFESLPDDLNVKHPLDAPFNPAAFLPEHRAHFRYEGSLTTPPCTEGVQWVVMSQPVTVSDEDVAQFAERIHFNARPVQRKQ